MSQHSAEPKIDVQPWERALLMLGAAWLIAARLFHQPWAEPSVELGATASVIGLVILTAVRFFSLPRKSYLRLRAADVILLFLLAVGLIVPLLGEAFAVRTIGGIAQIILAARILAEVAPLPRKLSVLGWNPAFVFVGSFVVLIGTGAAFLMLPECRVQADSGERLGTDWLTALFTSTSCSCVTGLAVVDTSAHWSRPGLVVMMLLIQVGGLGVMTFGAFFALGSQRGFFVREGVFMGSLLEQDDRAAVRRLLRSVLIFTIASEAVGAVLMTNLTPGRPLGERLFNGLFHSVSAFCNAGFALFPRNLEGLELRFEVWLVIAGLIVVGGLGFDVLRNTFQTVRDRIIPPPATIRRTRLSLTSKLVLATTACLLVSGTLGFLWFERNDTLRDASPAARVAHAWFQSVTCRTAGFNTLDFGKMHPASKFFAIILMFIGASPGSTGGGVKTVSFALTALAAWSILRRRESVEVFGRSVPDGLVKRAALVVAVALAIVIGGTMLLVCVENRPALFLDHLFETTSAFATVGLSTGITADLQPASKLTLIALMFIGRVGPITLLLALTKTKPAAKYEYPLERVALG